MKLGLQMLKYVIFKFIGNELPVIFPGDVFNHDNLKVLSLRFGEGKPVSAGKCEIANGEVTVSGDSFSLGLKSRKQDAEIILRALSK